MKYLKLFEDIDFDDFEWEDGLDEIDINYPPLLLRFLEKENVLDEFHKEFKKRGKTENHFKTYTRYNWLNFLPDDKWRGVKENWWNIKTQITKEFGW